MNRRLLLLLCLGLCCRIPLLAQCQTNIDFNTWSQEGYGSNGNWSVEGGGTSVFQTINGDPTFYVSPDTFINVRISGKIRIEDNLANDDDFVGFVFGYRAPEAVPNQYDLWLFDWKRSDQTKGSSGTFVGNEGFTLSRILGTIPAGDINYWPNFWAHDPTAACTPIATDYGGTKGWATFTDYNFTLLYTPTRATIIVNNDTIFDVPGCYEPGRFGFYNYSQPYVRYSNFSYNLISNFEIQDNNYDQCMYVPVNFLFTDSTCIGGTPIASNIASWKWDFGDGFVGAQTNPAYTYTVPGTYPVKLTVTDVNGCKDSITKMVTVHPPPVPSVVADSVFCPTDSVGLNGGGGISYLWSPAAGLSNPTIANPRAFPATTTVYTLTVTDQYNCESDTSVTFHILQASVDPGTFICEGDTILLGAAGGQTYDWTPTLSLDDPTLPNPRANPLTTTTYQAVVTDAKGCVDTVFQTIGVHPKPNLVLGPDTTVCANEPVTFTAAGALTYNWADSQGTLLGGGSSKTLTYSDTTTIYVLGADLNGCLNLDSTQLRVKPLPQVDAGADRFICRYETITIGSNNNPAGTYTWTPATQLDDPALLQPLFSPTGAGVFSYALSLTDLNGCTNTDQMSVTVHPFQLTETHSDVPCFGEPTGTSTLSLTASSPFTYTWLNLLGDTVSQAFSNLTSQTVDTLFAGSYLAVAVDVFGCTDTLPVQINEPTGPLSLNLTSLTDVDCFGNASGEIHVAATGGTPNYQYTLNGGFTFNNTGDFTGLGPAIYTVLVRDANLCDATLTDTVKSPTGLFAQITTFRHLDCFGANNGAFSLVGQGGAPPYQYSLDNVNFSSSLSVSNLAPGQDTVYFFDNNGCQVSLPFEIFEPPQLFASIPLQKGVDCFGNANGQIWISSNGGTRPHQFSLDGTNFQPDSTFANLSGGAYNLTVQDDSLCQLTIPFSVAEPAPLTPGLFSQQNVDCFGNATGELIFSVNGGRPTYQYSLDSLNFQPDSAFANLLAGTYTVTVVDDSSCVSQLSVAVTEPAALNLFNALQSGVDCYGNSSAFVRLDADGGSLPYQFSLDSLSLQPDSLFSNLSAGTYTFWVVDDSSCVDSLRATITQPDSLQLGITEQLDIDCFGNDNGSVLLAAAGGINPYLFGLDGGALQTDSTFGSLSPGLHTIRVQDDSLCVTTQDIDIFEPPLLQLSATATDVSCFGFDDGTGTVAIVGGTPGYDILWDSPIPQNTPLATDLGPGSYTVLVTDSNGCVESANIEVVEPDTLVLTIVDGSVVEAHCDLDNGEAAIEAAGGIGPYEFRWEGPSFREGSVVNMLFGDTTYLATVRDQNGCETTIPVYIPQTPPAIPIFSTDPLHTDSILLSQATVQFINTSIGAVAYEWEFGDGGLADGENPLHRYLEPGVYPVTLTAYNKYFVCPRDTTLLLYIIPDGALFIPNAFSPNHDGHNDQFYPVGEGLIGYQMTIYNRWGEPVFTLNSLAERWDGQDRKGAPVPEGVYVYRVTALMNDGAKVDRGGTVTLIR